ncbi:MAG: hypothetical protein AAGI48_04340 [Verrucomicrobiota bacterium]
MTAKTLILCALPFYMAGADTVKFVKDDGSWKLLIDDAPYYVKGFTWSHTPVGMKYDYNLFGEDESAIKAAIKRDMSLIEKAGGNTLRGVFPKKWMHYIHEHHGMRFIANDYCGRYGLTIDGSFVENVNYADPVVREIVKENWRKLATEYKDSPALLAHALGNENNYGLEWKSAEIENLPVGEQHRAKARHLYSLFNEVTLEIKKIDPDHPVGIVNGDLQYLDLIAELCPDIDFLGVNAYRGKDYSDMFERVAQTLDKPVLLMETGCDAYNAHEKREDQLSQARMIHDNWIDLYRNTADNGGEGNCIGALAFQWADEWWKEGQNVNLTVHNTEAGWHHQEYRHDAAAPNNMNEEWFGVCSIREEAVDGAHIIQPRAAYFVLKDLWKRDPYHLSSEELEQLTFDGPAMMAASGKAAAETDRLLQKAEAPYWKAQQVELPAAVYREGDHETLWQPSGVMPEENFITLDPNCQIKPFAGKSCLKIRYTSGGDWSGIQWQSPEGDWENNSPGGFDLSGATRLRFHARGEKGGEKIKVSMGGSLTGKYPNTASADLGELVLESDWKEYTLPLDGKDLRRIKNPLTLVMAGSGFPFTIYLDEVVYE